MPPRPRRATGLPASVPTGGSWDRTGLSARFLRAQSAPAEFVRATEFKTTVPEPGTTEITLTLPGNRAIDTLVLESPARKFIKAVDVFAVGAPSSAAPEASEASPESALAEGVVLFREPTGAERLRVEFPPTTARSLRVRIRDNRSGMVPFTGARIRVAGDQADDAQPVAVKILGRSEIEGATLLELELPAANLPLTAVGIESGALLFRRQLRLLAPTFTNGEIREKGIAAGTVFRIEVPGAPVQTRTEAPISATNPTRRLTLRIENGDNPPIPISAVTLKRRAVRLRFLAGQSGDHWLYVGNPAASKPNYDVAMLQTALRGARAVPLEPGAGAANPEFARRNPLAAIPTKAAVIDPNPWRIRRTLEVTKVGLHEVELDPAALSATGTQHGDWRLVRDGHQIPFVVSRPSIRREFSPEMTPDPDPDRPRVSRYRITHPHGPLPVSSLRISSDTALFDRDVTLIEKFEDRYGQRGERRLGSARWKRTPDHDSATPLTLQLDQRPQGGDWILEIQDGDDAPIPLENPILSHPVVRLVFATDAPGEVALYYDNPKAGPARYDLAMVAPQLLRSRRIELPLGDVEILKPRAGAKPFGEKSGILFWVILAAVVVALLFFVARLLPATASEDEQ